MAECLDSIGYHNAPISAQLSYSDSISECELVNYPSFIATISHLLISINAHVLCTFVAYLVYMTS